MGEIISRWSKKSLSQVINLLSGALIMILFINHFTVIDIRLDVLDFISVNYANLSESIIMWIFAVLLFHNFIFKIVRYIVKKCFPFNTEQDEFKYYNILVLIQTSEDVLDLMVSIYGLMSGVFCCSVPLKTGCPPACTSGAVWLPTPAAPCRSNPPWQP